MPQRRWIPLLISCLVLSCSISTMASAEVTIQAPKSIVAGAQVEVAFAGGENPRDFITIVPVGKPEGQYDAYAYARKISVDLRAPEDAGEYEIRYLSADRPFATLARLPLTVTPATATLEVPPNVDAGATFEVVWTGPDNRQDFVSLRQPGSERKWIHYAYTKSGSPAKLKAPDEPGTYEVAYQTGGGYKTLALGSVTIGAVSATVSGPQAAKAGEMIEVAWTGPDNPQDFIALSLDGSGPRDYKTYAYAKNGSPAKLRLPDEPGTYSIRYQTAQSYAILAEQALVVTDVTASLTGPAEVQGGTKFTVEWTGPNHRGDHVAMVDPEDERSVAKHSGWAYTVHGSPAELRAPLEPGDYELRYRTAQSGRTLATQSIRVTPPRTEPGHLKVAIAEGAGSIFSEGDAVELILDASGSMLKRQDGKRRIDIAREVLLALTGETIPDGTPFALRVFGHKEADSCRSDLEIPMSPLNADAADAKIGAVQAKNLAKTPIARSLELVAQDLKDATGERIVVLITDGEETCDGDPAAAIEGLKAAGIDVRVDIVGFAIDDEQLKSRFRYWAEVGGGRYHDAANAEDLSRSMDQALGAPYEVLDAEGETVATGKVGDDGVDLPAGEYRVRTRTTPALEGAVAVIAGKSAGVTLESR